LNRAGFAVAALHRGEAASGDYPLLSGDLASPETLREAGRRFSPDAIVHCASSSRGGADAYRTVFVEGIRHLRSVFPDAPVCFTSSTSVYGQTDGSRVDEASETVPGRETGRLLLEAESLAREGGGIALRLAGIYGPGRSVH